MTALAEGCANRPRDPAEVRILAWNLNHRARPRRIPATLTAAICSLAPDVVALTEYVTGPDHDAFSAALRDAGLTYQCLTAPVHMQNQVLVASRLQAALGALTAASAPFPAESNLLHVVLTREELDIVAMRVPMYTNGGDTNQYWEWFSTAVRPLVDRRTIVVGDFNADMSRTRTVAVRTLEKLTRDSWQLAEPTGAWSYHGKTGSTSRIDHALVAPAVRIIGAEYVVERGAHVFAGPQGGALSDHAALLLCARAKHRNRDPMSGTNAATSPAVTEIT